MQADAFPSPTVSSMATITENVLPMPVTTSVCAFANGSAIGCHSDAGPYPSYPFWEPISFWGTVLTGSVAPTTGYVTLYNNDGDRHRHARWHLRRVHRGTHVPGAARKRLRHDHGHVQRRLGQRKLRAEPRELSVHPVPGSDLARSGRPGESALRPARGDHRRLEHDATFAPYVPGGQATGSVDFYDNGVYLCSQPLDETTGQATLPTSGLAAGEHTISASYPGDYWYHDCGPVTFDVQVLAPTVTTLEPDPENGNPSAYGDGLTFLTAVAAQ